MNKTFNYIIAGATFMLFVLIGRPTGQSFDQIESLPRLLRNIEAMYNIGLLVISFVAAQKVFRAGQGKQLRTFGLWLAIMIGFIITTRFIVLLVLWFP